MAPAQPKPLNTMIDITKTYRTREGKKARILATDVAAYAVSLLLLKTIQAKKVLMYFYKMVASW